MVARRDVVEAAIALTVERGVPPSLAEVGQGLGLTKQGVLHYFPSRAALDEAVVLHTLDRVDGEMVAAAAVGRAAEGYLRLAAPSQQDRAAVLVLVAMLRRGRAVVPAPVGEAIARWEALMAKELGDPLRARVVRLVGDGLFGESLVSGQPPAADLLDQLVEHLVAGAREPGR